MPSGTTFTNEMDSCYNEVLSIAVEFLRENKHGIKLTMVVDQGDDAVMKISALKSKFTTEELANEIGELYKVLNMQVNPKKQLIANNKTEFLKRLHTKDRVESYRAYS